MVSKRTPPPPRSKSTSILSKISRLPLAKAVLSTAASAAATAMFLRSLARNYLPSELNSYLHSKLRLLLSSLWNETTLLIHEFDGLNKNRLFSEAALYVGSVAGPSAMTYRASLSDKEKNIDVAFCGSEEVSDEFRGIHLKWMLVTKEVSPRQVRPGGDYSAATTVTEVRHFRLRFEKQHKKAVADEYLPHVLETSETLKMEKKAIKLHTLTSYSYSWQSVNLDHPSRFETLAMADETKEMIVGDLERFLRRKELYRKVGKAWKRGYLLYGPPGTGKSSLIAAIANYLKFDVYDLELSAICNDSQLRRLLITTANRSILVVEDIDASVDLSERKSNTHWNQQQRRANPNPKVTLSGILNFIDGLWSSIGDERIIIFTTNHKEKLDPALLRPGRMDVHINMSFCTPRGFKLLAKNYLGITDHDHHPLIDKAGEMIASSRVTPAEIGEQLLKSDDPNLALEGLIEFLKSKRKDMILKLKENGEISDDEGDELTKLSKMGKALPLEKRQEILSKEEAVNAFEILTRLLESGSVNSKAS